MYFKTAMFSAIALLFAGQAIGGDPIASDAYAACNCPDNCSYREGSRCEYYADHSHHVHHGTCRRSKRHHKLTCKRH